MCNANPNGSVLHITSIRNLFKRRGYLMPYFRIFVIALCAGQSGSAQAHFGHVGELAGHGHLIGIGALLGAAALAAALRKPKKEKVEDEAETEEVEAEGEAA